MQIALLMVVVVAAANAAGAQPANAPSRLAQSGLCAALLDARANAESQGRIDFSAVVERTGDPRNPALVATVEPGSPYSVGRIAFTGHADVNDSTLRRAFTLREREMFDVGELRRSLARLNGTGLTEPVALADLVITRHPESATADIVIPLRTRGRRWWSLGGPIIPGLGSYDAAISSRLPAWGRGLLDASTYVFTFNVLALAKPVAGVVKFLSHTPPAIVMIERPLLPGQEWVSGFALSPALSAHTTIGYYGRTHLARAAREILADRSPPPLAVPVVSEGRATGDWLMCQPAKSRWRWIRRGAIYALDVALAALLP